MVIVVLMLLGCFCFTGTLIGGYFGGLIGNGTGAEGLIYPLFGLIVGFCSSFAASFFLGQELFRRLH